MGRPPLAPSDPDSRPLMWRRKPCLIGLQLIFSSERGAGGLVMRDGVSTAVLPAAQRRTTPGRCALTNS